MSVSSEGNQSPVQLTLFVEASPARTCRLPENGRALLESGLDYGSSLLELLTNLSRDGLSSKMSPAFYPVAAVPLVEPCADYLGSIRISDVSARSISRALSAMPQEDCLRLIEAATLPSSFAGWQSAGMAWLGGYLTLNTTDWHSGAAVCSLSQILEADVPQKYYLSAKACQGILRRAEKRGKALPALLKAALGSVATQTQATETEEV